MNAPRRSPRPVHVLPFGSVEPHDVYIGREVGVARDFGMPEPAWGNPFRNGPREQVIADYEAWMRLRLRPQSASALSFVGALLASTHAKAHVTEENRIPDPRPTGEHLHAAILGLEGKVLWCHCKATEPCHADVLIKLFNELANA